MSRAWAIGSTSRGTKSRRPFPTTIPALVSGRTACVADTVDTPGVGGPDAYVTAMNADDGAPPSSPSRHCRRQLVSNDRDTTCRRATAETCRCPTKFSSAIRIFSASSEFRRRGISSANRTSISGLNLRSAIRSDLSLAPESGQAVLAGGTHCCSPML